MRVLIIGYGSAGKRHAHNARELGHEVWVRDESEVALQDALEDDFEVVHTGGQPDAAIIATPAATHYDVAKQLQDAGFNGPLFVEKPLDVTTEHADFWQAWPSPCRMVGYNWRFVQEVQQMLNGLGEEGRRDGYEVESLIATNVSDWQGSEYASVLLECSHDIDLARLVAGPLMVRTTVWKGWPGARHTVPCDGFLREGNGHLLRLVGLSKGAWADLRVKTNAKMTGRHFTVSLFGNLCGGFTLSLDSDDSRHSLHSLDASYMVEMSEFLKAARLGVPVLRAATFEDGLAVVEIVEQAERMAKGKEGGE